MPCFRSVPRGDLKIMRINFLVTILFVGLLAPYISQAQTIAITEIMYDAQGTDAKHEWCEIYNYGSEPILVNSGTASTSWRFFDGGSHALKLIQGSATLAAQGTAIIAADSTTWIAEHPGFSGSIFDTAMSLDNTSGKIGFSTSAKGQLFISAAYTDATGANGNGHTIELRTIGDSTQPWYESASLGGDPGTWHENPNAPLTHKVEKSKTKQKGKVEKNPSRFADVRHAGAVQGIVIVPPHTFYSQKMYIQLDSGDTEEVYQSKGAFPKLSFGDFIEAGGTLMPDNEPPRLKIDSKANIKNISSGHTPEYATTTIAALIDQNDLSMVMLEGDINRISKSSLLLSNDEDIVTLKQMKGSKGFSKDLKKGTHIEVRGFLRFESGNPVVYIPDASALRELKTAMTAPSAERIIDGGVPDSPFRQWYVIAIVPAALMAIFAVKKYIVPRFF